MEQMGVNEITSQLPPIYLRKTAQGLHIYSFHGMVGKWENDILTFPNKNFTSNEYYSNTYIMSHFPKYWFFLTIGSRGRGKTFEGKQYSIKFILGQLQIPSKNYCEDRSKLRKFMWWRLTNDAVEKVKENSGRDFFENHLQEQYKIKVRVVNFDIMFSLDSENITNEDGETKRTWFPVGKIASIQEYYKYKGNQLEDYDVIIMDELVRAESERRTFNIPSAFINMIENVCRTRKGIRVMIYANAIGEMQEVKQLFGFMPLPGKFGVYKLFHKRAIIEYLDDSKEWKKQQEMTMAGVLRPKNKSEFDNRHTNAMEDKEDFIIQRKYVKGKRYFASVKIERGRWLDIHFWEDLYFVDTDSYTAKKMKKANRYALNRSLVTSDTIYSKDLVRTIQEIWEVGKFRFSSNTCYKWFTDALNKYNIVKQY